MKLLKTFNEENSSDEEIKSYRIRNAVRGVILDKENKIALLYARNNNYYDLPGGGVEEGESLEGGLLREMKEETGCNVEITRVLGSTIEIRKQTHLVNSSTGFVARVVGEKGETQMTPEEIGEGKEVMWVTVEEAKKYIRSSDTKNSLYHTYVAERDIAFLNAFVDSMVTRLS